MENVSDLAGASSFPQRHPAALSLVALPWAAAVLRPFARVLNTPGRHNPGRPQSVL